MQYQSLHVIHPTSALLDTTHHSSHHPRRTRSIGRACLILLLLLIQALYACLIPSSVFALEKAGSATAAASVEHGSQGVSQVLLEQTGRPDVFLAVDNSGSMRRGHRLSTAITALQRWAQSVETGDTVTVELLAASDHLTTLGTYTLGVDNGLSAFLAAIEALKPQRHSRTSFGTIDSALADFVVQNAKASDRVAVAIVSDGISDEPALDLALRDLGDKLIDLGPGVFACISGSFPNLDALIGRAGSDHPIPRTTRRPRSKLRQILSATVSLSLPQSSLNGKLRAKLFGGHEPARVDLKIHNQGALPRDLRIHVRGPDGSATSVEPTSILIDGNGRLEATIFVNGDTPVEGEILVTADIPDGVAAQASLRANLALEPWAISNMRVLALASGMLLLLLLGVWRVSSQPLLIAPIGKTDPSVELRRRDIAPIATFAPGFPADVELHRGLFGGLYLKSAGAPVSLSGVPLRPHVATRYQLRSVIEAAGVTAVLDKVRHSHVSSEPFFPSSGMSNDGLL